MVAPIAMPATDNPFIADTSTIKPMVPMASPPCTGPIHTWNILYRSSAILDSDSTYPMKMNIGRVSSGYQFISFIADEKGMSEPPVPHRANAAAAATAPIAPKTRWPVISISIMEANMKMAMRS